MFCNDVWNKHETWWRFRVILNQNRREGTTETDIGRNIMKNSRAKTECKSLRVEEERYVELRAELIPADDKFGFIVPNKLFGILW